MNMNKVLQNFRDRYVLLEGIVITMIGLFLPWVRIEWKYSIGIVDSTGIIILGILIYLLMTRGIVGYKIILSSIAMTILMVVQFMNFPRILNITWERSMRFSMDYVQVGFFITFLGVMMIMVAGFIKGKQDIR
ncbi:MAG: hypothetical protein JJT76_06765 [Clostridiaceae bacterium]|nr:hypothetical protein [Clostridiaceae bacterium]